MPRRLPVVARVEDRRARREAVRPGGEPERVELREIDRFSEKGGRSARAPPVAAGDAKEGENADLLEVIEKSLRRGRDPADPEGTDPLLPPASPDPGEGDFSAVVTNGSTVNLDWTDGDVIVYYNTADGSYSVNAGFGESNGIVISTPPNTAAGTYGLEMSASGNKVGAIVTDPDGYMSDAGGTITFITVTTSRIAATFDFDFELVDPSQNTIDKTITGSFDVSVDFAGKAPEEMMMDRMVRLILGDCPTCP